MHWFRYGCGILLLLFLGAGIVAATELTKDDIDFRKEVYIGKGNAHLPYRLFVPLGYDVNHKYPLVLWLHGVDGRGSDNVKQMTKENQLGSAFLDYQRSAEEISRVRTGAAVPFW